MRNEMLILVATIFSFACKKEKSAPAPEPAPLVHKIFVKINGVEKVCDESCFSSSSSGTLKGSNFYINGFDERIYIGYTITPKLGMHKLSHYGEPNVVYYKNNVQFHAVSGTLNVTAVDTSQNGVMKGLVATLDFKTDTSSNSGDFYNITEGNINIQ